MKLRQGKNPHNLHLQVGDAPADDDPCVGFVLLPDVADMITEGLTSPWHLNEIKLSIEAER